MNEPQFKCGIGLYVLADRALMPTIKQAESGEYIDCEPYLAVDYGDPESLVTALKQALQTGKRAEQTTPPLFRLGEKHLLRCLWEACRRSVSGGAVW